MQPIIRVSNLSKTYASGLHALKDVSLEIRRGEIFALLGPNGAGKTTLIGITCGLVRPTSGNVLAGGHDVVRDYRAARRLIGLVPQELTTDAFETVTATVTFSRGLFGKPRDPARIERVLRQLSLWDKRNDKIMTLSGGMKRRVMIAKALSHEPEILFLDEPSAGVDVELRRDMWEMVRELRDGGVTIILTTQLVMVAFLVLTSVTFSLFGFILGVWANGFEQLQIVPLLVVTPLAFLGGSFYSIHMLPEPWRTITLFNPVVYLISGFRWSFYGVSDVGVATSLLMTLVFLVACAVAVGWMFRTGYRLKA